MSGKSIARRLRAAALACAAACAALLLAGCQASYPSTADALKEASPSPTVSSSATIEPGVLTVGLNASNPPYSWTSSSSSASLQGIDVDSALAMAQAMGLTVKFVDVGTDYAAAAEGLCDVVMGATTSVTPASEVLVGNYLESAPAVFARGSSTVATVEQLAVSTVGVQADSVSARAVAAMAPTATLVSFDTLNDAFDALSSGTVDFVACDSLMGGYLAAADPSVSFAGALALPDMRGVAVSASNVELQSGVLAALDSITSNGILRTVREKWVGDLPSITTANQVSSASAAQAA